MLAFWSWLKKLFKKQEPKPNPIKEYNRAVDEFHEAAKDLTKKVIEVGLDTLAERAERRPPFQPLPASRQDIGKFMKHGHQAPWYRKSVKAKVKPEEED